MSTQFIGLDVHCQWTEVAVVSGAGNVLKRDRVATTIPELLAMIQSVRKPRSVVMEEGAMADWLYRELTAAGEDVTVSEPRRNSLIAKDSDKDDPIDAAKLAQLSRGNYVKRVHHADSLERAVFKQHVSLYHYHVRQRVRKANRIMGALRFHGLFVQEAAFCGSTVRPDLLGRLPDNKTLRANIQLLFDGYDVLAAQEHELYRRLAVLAREHEPIRRFRQLPGVGLIRASTFYAYVDTPWRFSGKSALYRYVGIGLERRVSGSGPALVRVVKHANRALKCMIHGSAIAAIQLADNPFAELHARQLRDNRLSAQNARRVVARRMADTLWGMWKSGDDYHPEWVNGGVPIKSLRSPARTMKNIR